jgi:hypothetical protein
MKVSTKIVLGVLTVAPGLFFLLFWPVMLVLGDGHDWQGFFGKIYLALARIFISLPYMFALVAFYLVHAGRREYLKEKWMMWAILLGFFGFVTLPVYWYKHVWREPKLD